MNLTGKIFLALIAGLAAGAIIPAGDTAAMALAIAEPIGNLWLQALQMTIIPLIAGLLFTGIAESVGTAGGGKVAASALLSFLFLLLFSGIACFAAYAWTSQPVWRQRGVTVVKWTLLAAGLFFAGLIAQRLVELL